MDFTDANDYGETFPFKTNIYSGDNLLVYQLVSEGGKDIWSPLPATYYFTGGGVAHYTYDFSFNDFSIFLDANFPLAELPPSYTDGKIFRIVVVPGDDGVNTGGPNSKSTNKSDYLDYNTVIKKYNIDDSNVIKLTK